MLTALQTGGLSLVAAVATATGGHCVAADTSGNIYVCDPKAGRILVIRDGGQGSATAP